jgi:hypothetical protein
MGYQLNGGIIEMLINFNNGVYLIAGGVVFIAIGYFVYKFIYEKHGISSCVKIYIPTGLTSFVEALGGIKNIVRFRDNDLQVRNPKLVNTVMIDCEINENIIISKDERFLKLMEYLQ